MPLIAIDMDSEQFEKVNGAVVTNGYSSVQQFLIVAAWNQVALHEADRKGPEDEPPWLEETPEEALTEAPAADPAHLDTWRSSVRRVEKSKLQGLLPDVSYAGDRALLWGQTNRVLPVAVGVRVLANLVAVAEDGSVSLEDWHKHATKIAQTLRSQLVMWDKVAGRGRSDQWATAFPTDDGGSANRFMGQFLGWPRRDGKIAEGGGIWLGFVGFADAENSRVSLTEAGASWASLPNPIFDGVNPLSTFSESETQFFIDHLRANRPTELGLLADVANLVQRSKSRIQIDAELEHLYPKWAKHSETMRAGALGRLSDLGLLSRERHGLTVSYHLTPLADTIALAEDAPGAA